MSIDDLIADIRATFPGVKAMKRESCTGGERWMIGAEQATSFPDGLSVFCDCAGCFESGTHDGGVHLAFAAWIENRGFYLEREDEFWFVPTGMPIAEEIAEWHAAYAIAHVRQAADPNDDGLPF
ncbi:hypothetical protein [Paraburkholderia phenoliruptrix]|uniref:hypothetical protein n=1 Tax=Paraburkholderia phenoliruptrix TaxID=252970 RepID=UPI002864D5D1|nr:hypothetical protein [Paraburkholderia phenoliruptrix]MDR6389192.1 hypothetical protein [Paraburkholderia phenoliruptrix]